MPRIRSLKPEIWSSQSIGRLSRDARLMLIGIITQADDHGRFVAHESALAAAVFPYDSDRLRVVRRTLPELEKEGIVAFGITPEGLFGVLTGWSRHQHVDRPRESRMPDPVGNTAIPHSFVAIDRDGVANDHRRIKDQGSRKGSRIKEGIKDRGSRSGVAVKETNGTLFQEQPSPTVETVPEPQRERTWQVRIYEDVWMPLREDQCDVLGISKSIPPEPIGDGSPGCLTWPFIVSTLTRMLSEFPEKVRDGALASAAIWFLDQPWAASPTAKEGFTQVPFPFRMFASEKIWRRAFIESGRPHPKLDPQPERQAS